MKIYHVQRRTMDEPIRNFSWLGLLMKERYDECHQGFLHHEFWEQSVKTYHGNFKYVKWFLAKVYFFIRREADVAGLWGTCWHQSRSLSPSWNLEIKVKCAKTYHRKSKHNGRTNQRFLAIVFPYKRRDCNCSKEHGDCDDRDRQVCPHPGLWE